MRRLRTLRGNLILGIAILMYLCVIHKWPKDWFEISEELEESQIKEILAFYRVGLYHIHMILFLILLFILLFT